VLPAVAVFCSVPFPRENYNAINLTFYIQFIDQPARNFSDGVYFSPKFMVIRQKYRIALDFHQGPAGVSIATQPAAK
jgi:hypothetical protein